MKRKALSFYATLFVIAWNLILCALAAPLSAQTVTMGQPSTQNSPSATETSTINDSGRRTITGCISLNSTHEFSISDGKGVGYILSGDNASLAQHVGHKVRVSGQLESFSGTRSFHVTSVTLVSDSCSTAYSNSSDSASNSSPSTADSATADAGTSSASSGTSSSGSSAGTESPSSASSEGTESPSSASSDGTQSASSASSSSSSSTTSTGQEGPSYNPPPAPSPSEDVNSPDTSKLIWNLWVEDYTGDIEYSPILKLKPEHQYLSVIDLAAISYAVKNGVFSKEAGSKLREHLLKQSGNSTVLQVLMLPDSTYFETPSEKDRVADLRIDLKKFRKAATQGSESPQEPFSILKSKDGDVDFSFGRASFKIATGSRSGLAYITFLFWAGSVPLEELGVPLCIRSEDSSEDCEAESMAVRNGSADSVFLAPQIQHSRITPQAGLAFVELGPNTMGVFRLAKWPHGTYVYWPLGRSAAEISGYLKDTILPNFARDRTSDEFHETGVELYRLLFPKPSADRAREAFEDFLSKPLSKGSPPSIFVRLLPDSTTPLFLVPLNLMSVPIGKEDDFVGFHAIVQSPLEVQNYETTKCVSNWKILVPGSDPTTPPELTTARNRFSKWLDKWQDSSNVETISDINHFSGWIGDDKVESKPTALFILSHHDRDSIYFTDPPRIASAVIQRRFSRPSIAIIDACGAAGPGALDFVRRLNEHGIATAIAASSLIPPAMAGDFLNELASVLETKQKIPISEATFKTLRRLRHLTPSEDDTQEYGPRVLMFSVLGNAALKVCLP